MLTGVSDTWGGVGIWHSRDAAEAMVAAPGDHMPWLGETVAAWHCLSVPVSHRGAVNWRGYLQNAVWQSTLQRHFHTCTDIGIS